MVRGRCNEVVRWRKPNLALAMGRAPSVFGPAARHVLRTRWASFTPTCHMNGVSNTSIALQGLAPRVSIREMLHAGASMLHIVQIQSGT